mmetsp:Transcript_48230/g.153985  ORF Transcript_48230/g.153985 Transcript_48230/m.153985 type:complete len:200 (+) Transcript_48230:779-1378(+)
MIYHIHGVEVRVVHGGWVVLQRSALGLLGGRRLGGLRRQAARAFRLVARHRELEARAGRPVIGARRRRVRAASSACLGQHVHEGARRAGCPARLWWPGVVQLVIWCDRQSLAVSTLQEAAIGMQPHWAVSWCLGEAGAVVLIIRRLVTLPLGRRSSGMPNSRWCRDVMGRQTCGFCHCLGHAPSKNPTRLAEAADKASE